MQNFNLAHLLRTAFIGGMASIQIERSGWRLSFKPWVYFIKTEIVSMYRGYYQALEQECTKLELVSSRATVKKILRKLDELKPSYPSLLPLDLELQDRLTDEIEGRMFWSLTLRESEIYSNPRRGWEEVIVRFPDAALDIEEAHKCFALSRYAAAVFHSMQLVEVRLIELGRILVVSDPQTGWNATTSRLEKILTAKYPNRTPFQRQHSSFIEQIYATVIAMKSAWRNKVSHVQGKLVLLTADFSPDVAEEILTASRSFMRRLATEAPTDPDPDA